MDTDNELKIKGLRALLHTLGEVETEKFISLMIKEPLDYTQWQKDLLKDKNTEDISKAAMDFRKKRGNDE